jgi:hypothetical protein
VSGFGDLFCAADCRARKSEIFFTAFVAFSSSTPESL